MTNEGATESVDTAEAVLLEEDFTPAEVRSFWDYMTTRYRTTVADKRSSGKMIALGSLLGALGILDSAEFLETFTTTLRRTICTPFTPGVFEGPFGGLEQVILCVHEHTHVDQYTAEGWRYEVKYIVDSRARALYEAEAYRTTQVLETWHYGAPRTTPDRLAANLLSYGCRPEDVAAAERYLDRTAVSAAEGAVPGAAAQAAVAWLDAHVPRLARRVALARKQQPPTPGR